MKNIITYFSYLLFGICIYSQFVEKAPLNEDKSSYYIVICAAFILYSMGEIYNLIEKRLCELIDKKS